MLRKLSITCQVLLIFASAAYAMSSGEDFYSSVSGMERLIESEMYLVETFESYIKTVNETRNEIKEFLDEVESDVKEIEEDPQEFFENPLNAFKVLKRIAIGWKRIENKIMLDLDAEGYKQNVSLVQSMGYPVAQKQDLDGASRGILLLQNTYQLKARDMASGVLHEYDFNTNLSASDCYVLGRTLYEMQEYGRATEWFFTSRVILRKELKEKQANKSGHYDFPRVTEIQILEFLPPSIFNAGNPKMAKVLNEELLALDPANKYGLENRALYENKVKEDRVVRYGLKVEAPPQKKSVVYDLYAKVCRGELKRTPREQRDLRCRYTTNNKPYRLIGPFRMEELSHDPFAVVFHNVIGDDKMEKIITLAEDKIKRSQVGDSKHARVSDIRTSKNTWFYYEQHEFLTPIGQVLHDITNLSLTTAEPFQVANYGLGGHYGPHFDFSEDPDNTYRGKGNRILTALFYINDVELGGGTAFPFLRILVPPEKGSLLVWYNLHESLEMDYRTKHAACPVLKGSKWICNQWFHQIGQELIRPCSLKRHGHVSLPFKSLT